MIYTIGHRESYRKALSENYPVNKTGRKETYSGGCVWKTPEEARAYLQSLGLPNYAVYEIDANWNIDVGENREGDPWHDLLRDARIVREVE